MKHQGLILYLTTMAIAIAGLLVFGVPASTLAYAALALACPLIMIFMPDDAMATTRVTAAPTAMAGASPLADGALARKSS